MPRQPRLDLPGVPQHLVQRGNDRQRCFFAEIDRIRYLQDLRELSRKLDIAVHAYVLMSNHVHLLVTSQRTGAISTLMQSMGRRYVRYINDRYARTGTLWEGRYKSCPVQDETYLLRCYRYIELNPVRAGMVADPADYRWSSHAGNALGMADALIQPHPRYTAIATSEARAAIYRRFVLDAIEPSETESIRLTLQRQHALGDNHFRDAIARQLGRRAGPAERVGRPLQASGTSRKTAL
ncbi:transposase [Pseudoxanthomonas composti]|uniref:Transposase n=1 Tax=Pseudoxanthomonas composti TaxID=2137479 RepID=A0A4Q1JY15_9GAMM|nr:transposase [Pseudoxanthomonas composti]RXR06569.1 transposase [Pseudoxanthomonas composti]